MGKTQARESQRILSQSAAEATRISRELLAEGRPARQIPLNYWSAIASGDPARIQPIIAPQQQALSRQFRQARESIRETAPRGGYLEQAESDLRIAEAGAKGSLTTQAINEALSRLAALGTFTTQSGIGAINTAVGAGGQLANLAGMRGAAFGSGISGIAGAIGLGLGSRGGGN